jgi:hypothetical protein
MVGVLLATNIDVVVPFIDALQLQILSRGVYYISELPSICAGPT